MSKLVLASKSPRRADLLKMLGLDFEIIPSKINEDCFASLKPQEMVQELARAKAKEVEDLIADALIIGADTIVVYEDNILGKPVAQQDAINMLTQLQGEKHYVYTGLAVYNTKNGQAQVDYDLTEVYFRKMDQKEITAYVKTGEPMDKAGAYGIQGLGGVFVERIIGSYFTVMGLPIHKLILMLKGFNIEIF